MNSLVVPAALVPAALLVAVLASTTACAAGGDPPVADPPAGPPMELSHYPPVPTPADLNAELVRGFDPSVPAVEKAAFVQGAEADPALIEQVVAAAVANQATVEITSIDDLGDGSLSAGATLTLDGQPNPTTMIFLAENGVWKLSRDNACAIVSLAGLSSPACPAGQ